MSKSIVFYTTLNAYKKYQVESIFTKLADYRYSEFLGNNVFTSQIIHSSLNRDLIEKLIAILRENNQFGLNSNFKHISNIIEKTDLYKTCYKQRKQFGKSFGKRKFLPDKELKIVQGFDKKKPEIFQYLLYFRF